MKLLSTVKTLLPGFLVLLLLAAPFTSSAQTPPAGAAAAYTAAEAKAEDAAKKAATADADAATARAAANKAEADANTETDPTKNAQVQKTATDAAAAAAAAYNSAHTADTIEAGADTAAAAAATAAGDSTGAAAYTSAATLASGRATDDAAGATTEAGKANIAAGTTGSGGAAAQAAIAQQAAAKDKCSATSFLTLFSDPAGAIVCVFTTGLSSVLAWLMYYVMSFAGFLLGIVGILFDWLVVITIFQFGAFFGNSQGLLLAWGIIRDIGNIMILFGFIYAGVMMILDLHSFDARKAIPRLIIFAVLLNFSLFAAEAIIDVANVVSAQLYQQAGQSTFQKCAGSLTSCGATSGGAQNQSGIAAVLIQDTYVGSGWSAVPNGNDPTATGGDPVKLLLGYIGTTVLIIILMLVLLIASIMLVIRGIALVIIMVLSPIGFAGMAVPQLEGMAKKWWHSLLSNAMFAPIFLLMVFVGLKIVDGLRTATASNLSTGAAGAGSVTLASALSNPSTSIGSIFIIYALVIGFFIAALIFSKSSGAAGASFATSFVQKTTGNMARGTGRAVAFLPKKAGAGLYRGGVNRFVRPMGDKYDAWIGKNTGVGKAFKFFGADEAIEKGFKKTQDVKLFGEKSAKEDREYKEHRDDHTSHAHEIDGLKQRLQAGLANNDDNELDIAIQKLPEDDLAKILKTLNETDRGRVARRASGNKLDALAKNKNLTAHMQEELVEAHFEHQNNLVETYLAEVAAGRPGDFKSVKDAARAMSKKERQILATRYGDLFNKMNGITDDASKVGGTGESVWTDQQADEINNDEGTYTTRQRQTAHGNKRAEQLKAAHNNGAPALTIHNLTQNMGKDIAKTSNDALLNPHTAAGLTREKLGAIMAEGNIQKPAEKQQILDNIFNYYSQFAQGTPEANNYEDMKNFLNNQHRARDWWGNTLP